MAGLPDAEPLGPAGDTGQPAFPTTSGAMSVPQDNELDPVLNQVSGLFHTDDSQAWAADIVQAIQQHVNMQRVADANREASAQFINNIAGTKNNLLAMVRDDPTSIGLAHTLAPMFLSGLIHNTGVANPDDVHADLTGHITDEVTRAAVQRMAELNPDTADKMLGQYGANLPQEDQDQLKQYIQTNRQASAMDDMAQMKQLQDGRAWRSGNAAVEYAGRLLNFGTENINFPEGYMKDLVKSQAILPPDKIALARGFNRLQQFGDPPVSDPYTVNRLVNQITAPGQQNPSINDVMDHVGTNLKYVDAQMINHMSRMQTPEAENSNRALADVLNRMREEIAPGDSRAGAQAFSRFTNWLLPAFRRTGPAGLDPGSDAYLLKDMDFAQWAPTHDDAVSPGPRKSLGQIFNG